MVWPRPNTRICLLKRPRTDVHTRAPPTAGARLFLKDATIYIRYIHTCVVALLQYAITSSSAHEYSDKKAGIHPSYTSSTVASAGSLPSQ